MEAGDTKKLAIVVYASGSGWDLNVREAQAAGEDIFLEEDSNHINLEAPTPFSNRTASS